MKLGIMQPYFFPYIGYFQLINFADQWIVFDDAQYIRHGWINRNRILHPQKGWQYITVPLLKHQHKDPIKNIYINTQEKWEQKIIGQLVRYKKAPYYKETVSLVKECFENKAQTITELNVKSLSLVCNYLNINFNYKVSSLSDFDYSHVYDAGDWAWTISSQMRASEYINPVGGLNLFDKNKFLNSGIKISFLECLNNEIKYSQIISNFEANLSIIDILMFCSVEEIKQLLSCYEVKNI